MKAEVIPVNEHTWRIEDSGVRFFLLEGEEKALLIDSGRDIHDARDVAESLTDRPVMLLNTHADMDHTGSNRQFESFYMHPAEVPLYRRREPSGTILPAEDGDVLDLGGRELISGDPVQEHGRIFMFGAHRSIQDYIRSLERLTDLTDGFDEIWPSHGDIPIAPDVIPRLIAGARRILAGDAEGKAQEVFGNTIAAYDLGFTTFLCDK